MTVESTVKIPFHYTTDTTMGDIMSRPEAWKLVQSVLSKGMFGQNSEVSEGGDAAKEAISDEMNAAMLQYMPLRGPVSFGGGVSMADVQKLVEPPECHGEIINCLFIAIPKRLGKTNFYGFYIYH